MPCAWGSKLKLGMLVWLIKRRIAETWKNQGIKQICYGFRAECSDTCIRKLEFQNLFLLQTSSKFKFECCGNSQFSNILDNNKIQLHVRNSRAVHSKVRFFLGGSRFFYQEKWVFREECQPFDSSSPEENFISSEKKKNSNYSKNY